MNASIRPVYVLPNGFIVSVYAILFCHVIDRAYPVTVETPCCMRNLVKKTHRKSCSEENKNKVDSCGVFYITVLISFDSSFFFGISATMPDLNNHWVFFLFIENS